MLSQSWRAETRDEFRPPAPHELRAYELHQGKKAKARATARAVRKLYAQGREYGAMGYGQLGAGENRFATAASKRHQAFRDRQNRRFLADATLCDSDGRQIALPAGKGERQRFASIYARARGVEQIAEARGLIALFCTATLPGEYHAQPSPTRKSAWAGLSPAEGQIELNARWRALGRDLARERITPPMIIRVVEPHRDGCPHWHWLAYVQPEAAERYTEICAKHFGDLDTPALKIERINRAACAAAGKAGASATSYLTKYLLKATGNAFDKSDAPADQVKAWRTAWVTRAVQFSGKLLNGSATAWDECRRLRLGTDRCPQLNEQAAALFVAAQGAGDVRHDFAQFVGLLTSLKAQERFNLEKTTRASGTTKIVGITIAGQFIDTHPTRWFLMPNLANQESTTPPKPLCRNDAALSLSYPSTAGEHVRIREEAAPAAENSPPAAPAAPLPAPAAPPPPPSTRPEHLAGPLGWLKSRKIYSPEQIAAGLHLPPTERQRVTNNPCVIIRHSLL